MMTGIQAYQRNENPLLERNDERKIQNPLNATSGKTKGLTENTATGYRQDRVSLSGDVETAKLRENLGLPISGKVTKEMLESSHEATLDSVNAEILKIRSEMGIPGDAEVSISLTEKGNIKVSSKAGGAGEMEKRLQEDTSFKDMLSALGLHNRLQEISMTKSQTSFFSNTEDRSLSVIARQYTALRQNPDSLNAVVSQIQNQTDTFTLKHDGETITT